TPYSTHNQVATRPGQASFLASLVNNFLGLTKARKRSLASTRVIGRRRQPKPAFRPPSFTQREV
ncbi:MAG: hypothetical protein FWD80_04600, partial [Propionibacteriaceae bacterium]|nr:hypothetical protein [Propionibacteriaceae bacterium]